MRKIRILFGLIILIGISSCDDFLEVNSDSKYEAEFVFSNYEEMNRALNGVYQGLFSGSTYGDKFLSTYALNSDVEFSPNSSALRSSSGNEYRIFDATSNGGDLQSTWAAAYSCIERANVFITEAENSTFFSRRDSIVLQSIAEAKVIRAMNYHDLVVLFGDIPFSFVRSYDREELLMPIVDRDEILTSLIGDLRTAAPNLNFAANQADGIERISKEFCWSMIARMALTRGGYSLRPDKVNYRNVGAMERPKDYKNYYEIAKVYCDSVISSGTHQLNLSYRKVFIDECNYIVNNNDDPIFEIPFAKNVSGSIGYIHGPKGNTLDDITSGKNVWGKSGGSLRLNAFYRYSFDSKDLRRDFVNGLWHYEYDGTPTILTDYSIYCNKWSKFWATQGNSLGVASGNSTGINFPYMRYADVLLMYAEAVNELEDGVNGPNGQKAIKAFKQVRSRAFDSEDRAEKVDNYITSIRATKEDFFNAIVNERKWEFGGENMRWKDLVRWNKYAQVVYDSFMQYYVAAWVISGDSGMDPEGLYDGLPTFMFYKVVSNPNDINIYPNTTLDVLEILNPYEIIHNPGADWQVAEPYNWVNGETASPTSACLYSFRGYIIGDEYGQVYPRLNPNDLPPVRYILPYPQAVLRDSNGKYQNYYGYN